MLYLEFQTQNEILLIVLFLPQDTYLAAVWELEAN